MSKLMRVASHHFRRNVLKKSFIFVLLSVPLFLVFTIGMGLISSSMENNDTPVGYVDHSGLLSDPVEFPEQESDQRVTFIPFENESQATAAMDAGEIQAYFVLPENYFSNRDVEMFFYDEPGENAKSDFYDFLKINLVADMSPEVIERVSEGNRVIIRTPDGSRELPSGDPTIGMVLPLVLSLAFIGLVLFSAGYMLEGVAEEKLNRTIEVVFTSISSRTLIGGKILGIVGINFLQLLTWIVVGVIAVFIAANVYDLEWFQNPQLDWGNLLTTVAIAIPTYIIATGLMLAVGSTVVEAQEGQALGFFFYMLMISPLVAIVAIGENPNGPLAIGMSILPFTSLFAISLRNLFISIPAWQIALSILVLWLSVILSLWLATRAFRLGMLRYGQRLRLDEILGRTGQKDLMQGELQGSEG